MKVVSGMSDSRIRHVVRGSGPSPFHEAVETLRAATAVNPRNAGRASPWAMSSWPFQIAGTCSVNGFAEITSVAVVTLLIRRLPCALSVT